MHRAAAVICLVSCPAFAETAEQAAEYRKAVAMMERGEYQDAHRIFEDAWSRRKVEAGAYAQETLDAQLYLGQTYTILGRPHDGLNHLGPLVEHWKKTVPADDVRQLIAQSSFAMALREAGRPDDAARILHETVRLLRAARPDDGLRLPRVMNELCSTLCYQRKFRQAIAACRDGLDQMDRTATDHAPQRAALLTTLGQALLLAGRRPEAVSALLKARDLLQLVTPDHPELATIEAALGMASLEAGRAAEAEHLLASALTRYEQLLGADHPEAATVKAQLAAAIRRQDRNDEARQLEIEARQANDRWRRTTPVSAWALRLK